MYLPIFSFVSFVPALHLRKKIDLYFRSNGGISEATICLSLLYTNNFLTSSLFINS